MGIKLSYSAAQKYLLSPFSYFAHYFLRLRPTQQSSALAFGAALDSAFNSLLMDKKDGITVQLSLANRIFTNEWNKVDLDKIKFSKADLDENILTEDDLTITGPARTWRSLLRKGHLLIEEYYNQVLPKLEKVLLVQHTINMTNKDGDAFTGIVDLVAQIDGKIYLCDNKSSSTTYKADSADTSEQLSTYYEALKDNYNLAGVAYIIIPKALRKKKKPVVDIKIIFGQAHEELIAKTFNDYDKVLHGIKTAQFPCTPEKCLKSPFGCVYKDFCASQGKNLTGLEYVEKRNEKK